VIESVRDGMLHFDNGKSIHLRRSSDFIEPGEFREIELCPGDIIQFGVNLKERKIYNGNLAKITADPGKVMMLNYDGSDRELAELPANCSAINHGWVTTSYKSQGRTADTVVVAAQEIEEFLRGVEPRTVEYGVALPGQGVSERTADEGRQTASQCSRPGGKRRNPECGTETSIAGGGPATGGGEASGYRLQVR
jgi:hypothetical protein